MIDFSKYKYFYVNGCSHTEGGGLEEESIRTNSVIKIYENLYNVSWNTKADVNFGKRLSEIIQIPCINESKSGSGTDRVVRMAYNFIYEHWEDKDNFFLILETPDPSRSEVYFNKINDYVIVNSQLNTKTKKYEFSYATREYFNKKYKTEDVKYLGEFKLWFENHFNYAERLIKDDMDLIGLYSFCKINNIKIFLMCKTNYFFSNCFDDNDIINFNENVLYNHMEYNIYEWCKNKSLLIKNETNNRSTDTHPGYFGHIEYAKLLAEFLGWEGIYPDYPNYEQLKINYKKNFI